MFLIHKVASRRPSRDHIAVKKAEAAAAADSENTSTMENPIFNYHLTDTPAEYSKTLEKRRSKSRPGLFGGKASQEDDNRSQDSKATMAEKEKLFGKKNKLRKAASKASFSPVTEEDFDKPPKSPMFQSLKSRSRTSSNASFTPSAREARISQPFNFFHISHTNQRDLSSLHASTSSLSIPKGTNTPPLSSPTSPTTKKHYSLRSKFLSKHQPHSPSTVSVEFDPTPSASEESFVNYAQFPVPPPRSSSRQAFDDFGMEHVREQFVCHAITTPGDAAFGQKSPGIERVLRDAAEYSYSNKEVERSYTPPIPGIRETQATPDIDEDHNYKRRSIKRVSLRIRPISQFSELNAEFIVPGSPHLGPRSRASRRLSNMKSVPLTGLSDMSLDESWEEDIDYSYEHAAESHCDYEWDRCSNYAPSMYAGEEEDSSTMPTSTDKSYLVVPEKKKEYAERRITGQFEAHLLLPGSAGSDTTEAKVDTLDYESGIILLAAHNSLCNRSIESMKAARSSSSASRLLSGRHYRDELARAAEHLDDHIAFLNTELTMKTSRDSLRPPSQQLGLGISTGRRPANRARTDSDATCVTLCSDADTITPTDSAEVITPPNSNHNSFTFSHSQYDEMRVAKGLSFPASTIPGVIEFSPEIHDLPMIEGEIVQFI
ncbi:hypothetical protein DFH27DRAFT_343401 [Peziza echinospora]|nr:hypothetical protein DFH27DRAFT_343401 [Peziza echinospora]